MSTGGWSGKMHKAGGAGGRNQRTVRGARPPKEGWASPAEPMVHGQMKEWEGGFPIGGMMNSASTRAQRKALVSPECSVECGWEAA